MNKREKRFSEMEDVLTDILEEMWYERKQETMQLYAERKDSVQKNLISVITENVESIAMLIETGEKRPVRFIHFSFLLSEVLQKKLILKIDYYDERYFRDISDIDSFWDYSELFPYIDEDMAKIRDELQEEFISLKNYDILDIEMLYHVGVFAVMKEILASMVSEEDFLKAVATICDVETAVLNGAYSGQTEVIGHFGREAEKIEILPD